MATVAEKFLVIHKGVTFEFERAEEGGYVVSVPAAPGCWSQGDTFEEALEMIQDALQGWLAVARKRGLLISDQLQGLVPGNPEK